MKHLLLTTIAAVVLVGCGPPPPDISIHEAVRNGNIEAVKQHIAAGTDVNAKSRFGETPLLYAASKDSEEFVELLIANGADVNPNISGGWNPLYSAALAGRKEIVELLIAKGADVNVKNKRDKIPLYAAARNDRKEIAELLLAKGADVNAEINDSNSFGKTPLDVAIQFRQTATADILRKHGGKTGEELKAEGK